MAVFCGCYVDYRHYSGADIYYMNQDFTIIQQQLLLWFQDEGRALPWRKKYDPYHVWISEIMLQQTQMERGVEYFQRWIDRLPDIVAVADAEEEEILKLWEGLGYYARARNLHKTARIIKDNYYGRLPKEHGTLLTLPGIGPYTASAIASIAFNQDFPVVDANVERIFARIFDIDAPLKHKDTKKKMDKLAWRLLPSGNSRQFNQALMEFGGLVCTPKNPLCAICPIAQQCQALLRGVVHERPLPRKGKKVIPIEMATGILFHDDQIFIQKRLENDIWGGLWEFPGGRLEEGEQADEAMVREFLEETELQVEVCEKITTVVHHYTRYKVILHCFTCRFRLGFENPVLHAAQESRWIQPKDLHVYGFPAGHRKLIEYINKQRAELFFDSDG